MTNGSDLRGQDNENILLVADAPAMEPDCRPNMHFTRSEF
jgi:hypothetical protein